MVHGEQEKVPEVQVWGTFRGNEWGNKGEKLEVLELKKDEDAGNGEPVWAFAVRAAGKKDYLIERQGCEFFPPWSAINEEYGGRGILIGCFSLAAGYPEEPDDPHCACVSGCRVRDAVPDG